VRYPQHRHERKQGARQLYTVKKYMTIHTINATQLTDDWSINQSIDRQIQDNIKYT